jgi:two-component system, NarL family, sensor histidine kinase UhpB
MVMPRFSDKSFLKALSDLTKIYSYGQRNVNFEVNNIAEEMIPAGIKETIYRIAQEQLHNIDKYASATDVSVLVTQEKDLISLFIGDNGVGYDTKKTRPGIGITNILNRTESYNGKAKIISSPGKGCKMLIEIPISGMKV